MEWSCLCVKLRNDGIVIQLIQWCTQHCCQNRCQKITDKCHQIWMRRPYVGTCQRTMQTRLDWIGQNPNATSAWAGLQEQTECLVHACSWKRHRTRLSHQCISLASRHIYHLPKAHEELPSDSLRDSFLSTCRFLAGGSIVSANVAKLRRNKNMTPGPNRLNTLPTSIEPWPALNAILALTVCGPYLEDGFMLFPKDAQKPTSTSCIQASSVEFQRELPAPPHRQPHKHCSACGRAAPAQQTAGSWSKA